MKSLILFAAALCLPVAGALAQSSYGNITVTGTASVNELDTSGPVDLQGNSAYFGSWQTNPDQPGMILNYSDATTGTAANLSTTLTRPGALWSWLRLDGSGNAWGVMELDGSNQLVLTGTQTVSPGSIVIDPTAGQITINNQPVLTNGSGLGLTSSGFLGIGTTTPGNELQVGAGSGMDSNAIAAFYGPGTSGGWISIGSSNAGKQLQLGADATAGFIATLSNQPIAFRPDNSTAMTILPGGAVGIGTASPDAQLTVNPAGNSWAEGISVNPAGDNYSGLYFRTTSGSTNNTWFFGKEAGTNNLSVYRNNLSGMVGTSRSDAPFQINYSTGNITFGGSVGVGATTPDAQFTVDPTGATWNEGISINPANDDFAGLYFRSAWGSAANTWFFGKEAGTNNLSVYRNGLSGMIGTTNGESPFEINYTTGNAIFGGSVGIGATTPDAQFTVNPTGDYWNEGISINPSGDGYGALYFRTVWGSISNTWFFGKEATTNNLAVYRSGLSGMVGTSRNDNPFQINYTSGNATFGASVGIGTSTPAAVLEVNGSTQIDNVLTVLGSASTMPNQTLTAGSASILTVALANGLYLTPAQAAAAYLPLNPSSLSVTGNTTVSGTTTAAAFVGDGSHLTNITFTQISGTLPATELSGTLPATVSGANITGVLHGLGGENPTFASVVTTGSAAIGGGVAVTGSSNFSGNVVVSGTGSVVLINPAGDISMGTFNAGPQPQ